jgi:hypothetical protein
MFEWWLYTMVVFGVWTRRPFLDAFIWSYYVGVWLSLLIPQKRGN